MCRFGPLKPTKNVYRTKLFQTMKTSNTLNTSASKIILPETMSKIERLDRSLLSTDEQFHLDLFLLSCYTGGISLKDLAHLTKDKINGDKLDCSAISYPHVDAITICDKARAIIDRYKDRSSGDYLLPILGKQHKTETHHHQNNAQALLSTLPRASSRNSRRKILPTLDFGNSSRNSTSFGTL